MQASRVEQRSDIDGVSSMITRSSDSTSQVIGRRHVLDLDDFSKEEIQAVLQNAEGMKEVLQRDIKKVPTLRGKSIITLFYEASTRTRVSFEQAGKILSADVINVSKSGSSIEKGESLYNTALTLQAMNADIIVIRHPHSGAPHFLARFLDAAVINAGDGMHAHPTQSLLDMYTIQSHMGRIEGLKITIVGDLLYSRVARSNLWGLTKMGAEIGIAIMWSTSTVNPIARGANGAIPPGSTAVAKMTNTSANVTTISMINPMVIDTSDPRA